MPGTNTPAENNTVHSIPFQDNQYRLSRAWLEKQVDPKALQKDDWSRATLKFLSFQQGLLSLLNTSGNRSYKLALQVHNHRLLAACSCGNSSGTLCIHIYKGLSELIWHLGERYFSKLQPHGTIALAFTHKSCFDKEESVAGLDVAPRPELQSIYQLAPEVSDFDLPAILRLPAAPAATPLPLQEEALGYLFIISFRNRLLPALLPCLGKLNKNRAEIKTWNKFLTGIQKQYNPVLAAGQQELNTACYHLWKMVEKMPGYIIREESKKDADTQLAAVFNAWKTILPSLQKQPFVYSFLLFGQRELKNKPARRRIDKLLISGLVPSIEFLLLDKGPYYRFQVQVRVNEKILPDYDARATFFILHRQTLYMLSSLRDAALAEWLYRSGGWVTIFKEHYPQFEQEILEPLRKHYPVTKTTAKKQTPKKLAP